MQFFFLLLLASGLFSQQSALAEGNIRRQTDGEEDLSVPGVRSRRTPVERMGRVQLESLLASTRENFPELNRCNYAREPEYRALEQNLNNGLEDAGTLIEELISIKPEQIENLSEYNQRKRAAEQLQRDLFQQARYLRLCLFRYDLNRMVRGIIANTRDRELGQTLQVVAHCLSAEPEALNGGLRANFRQFFNNLFSHFWRRAEASGLSENDCAVLRSSYAVWASFNDDDNRANIAAPPEPEAIPVYNVNDHNASFYYWSREQANGRIPASGLTIFHADTHTDMGHIHVHGQGLAHTHGHWSDSFMSLRDIQLALNDREGTIRNRIVQALQARENISNRRRAALLRQLASLNDEEIRQELETELRRSVHHIAQPLAGAQAAGVSNRHYIMCMPPWSQELPRTGVRIPAGQVRDLATSVPKPLEFYFSRYNYRRRMANGAFRTLDVEGFLMPTDALPPAPRGRSWNIVTRSRAQQSFRAEDRVNFQVGDCNNEVQAHGVTREREDELPPFHQFFPESARQDGYLLDLDLDVFVSEGYAQDLSVMPYSFERPIRTTDRRALRQGTAHVAQYGNHEAHDDSNETDPRMQVTSLEFGLIQRRIDSFFQQLAEARDKGFVPRVITIADSTAINRAIRSLDPGAAREGIQAYTPSCLGFLVNYMVRQRLQQTFPVRMDSSNR